MTKMLICAAGSLLAMVALPSVAAAVPQDIATSDNSAPAAPAAEASKPERKYCVVDTATGTRIRQKICKTRTEWLQEGFDPLNP